MKAVQGSSSSSSSSSSTSCKWVDPNRYLGRPRSRWLDDTSSGGG